MAKIVHIPEPPPLPATREELLKQRRVHVIPNINDDVDRVLNALWEDPLLDKLLNAIHPAQAVTGRLQFDDYRLAEMIFAKAKEMDLATITKENLGTVHSALQVVLRRYGLSRGERKNSVMGRPVTSPPPAE